MQLREIFSNLFRHSTGNPKTQVSIISERSEPSGVVDGKLLRMPMLLARQASPHWGVEQETSCCHAWPYLVYIY